MTAGARTRASGRSITHNAVQLPPTPDAATEVQVNKHGPQRFVSVSLRHGPWPRSPPMPDNVTCRQDRSFDPGRVQPSRERCVLDSCLQARRPIDAALVVGLRGNAIHLAGRLRNEHDQILAMPHRHPCHVHQQPRRARPSDGQHPSHAVGVLDVRECSNQFAVIRMCHGDTAFR